jgi:hypothetical protein
MADLFDTSSVFDSFYSNVCGLFPIIKGIRMGTTVAIVCRRNIIDIYNKKEDKYAGKCG